jgi:hypothetical protein
MPLTATDDHDQPTLCVNCRADSFGCSVRLGLSGRRCCSDCSHHVTATDPPTRESTTR